MHRFLHTQTLACRNAATSAQSETCMLVCTRELSELPVTQVICTLILVTQQI